MSFVITARASGRTTNSPIEAELLYKQIVAFDRNNGTFHKAAPLFRPFISLRVCAQALREYAYQKSCYITAPIIARLPTILTALSDGYRPCHGTPVHYLVYRYFFN